MNAIVDHKTDNNGFKYDYSLSFLNQFQAKIILHALELYNVSQEDFLKNWRSYMKKNPEIANSISEVCFNEVKECTKSIEESKKLINLFYKEGL